MTLPPVHRALRERLLEVVPPECLEAGAAATPQLSLRLNPLRAPPHETRAELEAAGVHLREEPALPLAFTTDAPLRSVQACAAWCEGRVHVQSLPSIAAAICLGPRPGHSVLDLCAAPGSKTSHIAALMENSGTLVAVDSSRARTFRLQELLRLLGARAHCITAHGERWARGQREAFDRVLVDAPCSAEGRILAGDEAAAAGWSPGKVRRLASLQKALLNAAIETLKPGGLLLYSTCTFSPEENELVVERALDHAAGAITLEPLPIALPHSRPALTEVRGKPLPPSLELARRVLPPQEGFFLALLRKTERPRSQSATADAMTLQGPAVRP